MRFLVAALFCFAVAFGLLLIVGCSGHSSPTEFQRVETERFHPCPQSTCTAKAAFPLPSADQSAAIAAGRARAETMARKRVNVGDPAVLYLACNFVPPSANLSGCAAGITDFPGKRIIVSTQNPGNTAALVTWEAANFFLISVGRGDLAA
jgi:hypothetical protein